MRELKAEGLLEDELHGVANLAQDEIEALQKKGYQEHEAREVVLRQLILLPPEQDEDDEQSRELAEKEAEYQRNPPGHRARPTARTSPPSTSGSPTSSPSAKAPRPSNSATTSRRSRRSSRSWSIRPIRVLASNQPGSRHSCSLQMTESLFNWSALSVHKTFDSSR